MFAFHLCAIHIFDHLYVSLVKLYSFLCPLSFITKEGRKCGFWRFYMLGGAIHVNVRERCVLFVQGERIMYFGVLCPNFFIAIHVLQLYFFIICHCFPHGAHNMFVKCFQERQLWSQSKQSILVCTMVSRDWLFLDQASLFEYRFILCIQVINVLGLLL